MPGIAKDFLLNTAISSDYSSIRSFGQASCPWIPRGWSQYNYVVRRPTVHWVFQRFLKEGLRLACPRNPAAFRCPRRPRHDGPTSQRLPLLAFNGINAAGKVENSVAKLTTGKKHLNAKEDSGGFEQAIRIEHEQRLASLSVRNLQNLISYTQMQEGPLVRPPTFCNG